MNVTWPCSFPTPARARGNTLAIKDLSQPGKGFIPLVTSFEDNFNFLGHLNGKLLIHTDKDAPNGKVLSVDAARLSTPDWQSFVPEQPHVLDAQSTVGNHVFLTYLKDVSHMVQEYDASAKLLRTVQLPGLGTVGGFSGDAADTVSYYAFTSFTFPAVVYRYSLATGRSQPVFDVRLPFDPTAYETQQVFYPSKDGTHIPLFLVHKKGLKPNKDTPTLLYGYGGFNINLTPSFTASRLAWLEQGGVYAQASLRGGNEYGEKWHQAGIKANKQNVFDDFIAAADYLVAQGLTSRAKLAIEGRSNGGILVGAVLNQRPDLCAAALPAVGVMDMLRFHKFTIGYNWISDYGSSDDAEGFKYLAAYSPLHNLKPQCYPAVLVTTADHDDRVVPAHSFKYAARLQAVQQCQHPVLIRIETQSGHGSSSIQKALEVTADSYSFLWKNLGVSPKF